MTKNTLPRNLASLFGNASDSSKHGLNAILAGDVKVGKTTLVSTAQDCEEGKDLLIVDSDSGTRSISHRTDIHTFVPKSFDHMRHLSSWLMQGQHSYKTVAIDTLTVLQHLSLEKALEGRGASSLESIPGIQDYNRANRYMLDVLRGYRDLSTQKGMNVIMVCHTIEKENEQTKATDTVLALRPALREEAALLFDMIWFMGRSLNGKPFIQFAHTSKYPAASRQSPEKMNLPQRIENPNMPDIFKLLGSEKPAKG